MSMESEMMVKELVKELRKTRDFNERKMNSEIAARDRVDISLSHYEGLLDRIAKLQKDNNEMSDSLVNATNLFAKIGIPVAVLERIDISDVEVNTFENPVTLATRYGVSFSVKKDEVN